MLFWKWISIQRRCEAESEEEEAGETADGGWWGRESTPWALGGLFGKRRLREGKWTGRVPEVTLGIHKLWALPWGSAVHLEEVTSHWPRMTFPQPPDDPGRIAYLTSLNQEAVLELRRLDPSPATQRVALGESITSVLWTLPFKWGLRFYKYHVVVSAW